MENNKGESKKKTLMGSLEHLREVTSRMSDLKKDSDVLLDKFNNPNTDSSDHNSNINSDGQKEPQDFVPDLIDLFNDVISEINNKIDNVGNNIQQVNNMIS